MASHFSSRKPVAFICSAQSALNTPTTTPSPSPPLHLPDSLPRKKQQQNSYENRSVPMRKIFLEQIKQLPLLHSRGRSTLLSTECN